MQNKKCFLIILIIAFLSYFVPYHKINLMFSGPYVYNLYQYAEMARNKEWNNVIKQTDDKFLEGVYGDINKFSTYYSVYNYGNVPGFLLYKIFGLRGTTIWFCHKIILSVLGVSFVVVLYLIGEKFYDRWVAITVSILAVFSPHLWIAFNLDNTPLRSYNIFFSFFAMGFFILYDDKKTKILFFLTAITFALNYFFFHIGSFIYPLIVFIFKFYETFIQKEVKVLLNICLLFIASFLFYILFDICHQKYFHLGRSFLYEFLPFYQKTGNEASHSPSNFLFLHPLEIPKNLLLFFQAIFINGKWTDGHFLMTPPWIPLVYNHIISFFFPCGCFIAIRDKKKTDIFFLIWFLVFFVIYGFLVIIRTKNMIWIIPSIFFLSARGVDLVSQFALAVFKKWNKEKFKITMITLLIIFSIFKGSYHVFFMLPQKNFYDGASMIGAYQIYKFLKQHNLGKKSSIIFAHSIALSAQELMLRHFTEDQLNYYSLLYEHNNYLYPNQEGVEKLSMFEQKIKEKSDQLFYIFYNYDTHINMNIYQEDEVYRNTFLKLHPDAEAYEIKGTDGKVLCKIYKVDGML